MIVIKAARSRTMEETSRLSQDVSAIINHVRKEGDDALIAYNTRFDGNERRLLRVDSAEISEAYDQLKPEDIADLKAAAENIRAFALAQKNCLRELPQFEPTPGLKIGHRVIPVGSCCCYVPGGGYPLYSTALMLAIPAKTAGVKRVVACSPTLRGSDRIHAKTLAALHIAGVDEIYALGGAHAVAAFAYGTEQIKAVDLIVGPGNQYVSEAKHQCYGQVGIDFIAGPSEVLIIADGSADPQIIAADLLAQSEHDLLAKSILITTDSSLTERVTAAIEEHLKILETAAVARLSWDNYGEIILADSIDEAIDISNHYAPEHLELIVENENSVSPRLLNYGSLFIGQGAAEVFGDYASGTNHTLPTLRASRYTGGLWVGTFLKVCTHQSISRDAMLSLAPLASRLARGEGLSAHALASEIRARRL
jgi:histidinol dehydrogenase